MKYYSYNIKKIFNVLNSKETGLDNIEANNRLQKFGKNKMDFKKRQSNLCKFLNEFKDLMIIILILSAIVSFILSLINNNSYIDSIIIISIVILNAILSFIQELKADKAIESLKKMQTKNVKVKRDNKIYVVNSEDIVKGDIIVLEAGDTVPADARIIWQTSLKVDESALTGESSPVSKSTNVLGENVALALRENMIYSGTNIVYGKCQAVVCEVGMNTEFGIIAKSLDEKEKELTPLQEKIIGISKFLSLIIFIIIIVMFLIGLLKGITIIEIIMLSISLAVAAIPEGLPAIITIILSLGMNSLAKKNAIVRKMSSVETLGCTEIICSDKTGTITQNKMTVREIFYNNKIILNDFSTCDKLLNIMALNNDVLKNNEKYIGDPTEIALYECCENLFNVEVLKKTNERIDELPFDSERKMMSTIHNNNGKIIMYTKGSFDSLIKNCTYIYENNKIIKLTREKIDILKKIESMESSKAYRVLAYAYKELNQDYNVNKIMEKNLIFVGMTMMIDPPRNDVKKAIALCKDAHIKPIMITGDSLKTATSIAKEIGILENDNEAIIGEELDKMSNEELKINVNNYSVYARVSPINKLSIVKAFKENGIVVAMTGDGVNDAPALKDANIGIGMGISGTEVSKEVSDIILVDDSFSTIVSAVKEGRRIFDNIRNIIVYLLAGNIAEILIVFLGLIFGFEIFLPIQLLYLNLVTDSIPAISLDFEKEEKNIMRRQIRKKDTSFFTPFLIAKLSISAILKTFAILIIYFINLKLYNIDVATSMAFFTLILLEMTYAFNCKNLKKIILKDIFNNKFMNISMIILFIIQIVVFLTPLRKLFNIISLNLLQIIYCFIIVLFIFMIDELSKNITYKIFKDD